MTQIHSTPEQIEMYRLRVLLSALKLEIKGLGRKGVPVSKLIKSEFGFEGDKHDVRIQLEDLIKDKTDAT